MQAQRIPAQRPLPVGTTFNYVFDTAVSGDPITSTTVTAGAGVTVGIATVSGNLVDVRLTGVTAGLVEVELEYTLASGRSACVIGVIRVVEC